MFKHWSCLGSFYSQCSNSNLAVNALVHFSWTIIYHDTVRQITCAWLSERISICQRMFLSSLTFTLAIPLITREHALCIFYQLKFNESNMIIAEKKVRPLKRRIRRMLPWRSNHPSSRVEKRNRTSQIPLSSIRPPCQYRFARQHAKNGLEHIYVRTISSRNGFFHANN